MSDTTQKTVKTKQTEVYRNVNMFLLLCRTYIHISTLVFKRAVCEVQSVRCNKCPLVCVFLCLFTGRYSYVIHGKLCFLLPLTPFQRMIIASSKGHLVLLAITLVALN